MVYQLDDKKVLETIDCIVKDTDKKLDECLVEKFFEFIRTELDKIPCGNRVASVEPILGRLRSYMEHEAFVMLNQARAFKTLLAVVSSSSLEFDQLKPYLDSLWATMDVIIVNANLSAMTILLQIFCRMCSSEAGFRWVIDQKIKPSIKLLKPGNDIHELKDLTKLVTYYMETCNNYHTLNVAKELYKTLILCSMQYLDPHHSKALAISNSIKNLMLKGSHPMISILNEMLASMNSIQIEKLSERCDIFDILDQSIDRMLERPGSNINNLCKCLAYTCTSNCTPDCQGQANASRNFSFILEKLKAKDRLDGIVVYIANLRKEQNDERNLLTYILYPLQINSKRGGMLELSATKEESEFIAKNMNSRLIVSCLAQLNQMVLRCNELDIKTGSLDLIASTLTSYIECHLDDSTCYRNIMECYTALERLLKQSILHPECLFITITLDDIHRILGNSQTQPKPIILGLIKVLSRAQSSFEEIESHSVVNDSLMRAVKLAFKFDDLDILNEFAQFFTDNTLRFHLTNKSNTELYINLLWKHMYLSAKEKDHQELLENSTRLLLQIDLRVDSPITISGLLENDDIANFYLSQTKEDEPSFEEGKMALSSMVDDILNYDLLSDGISDCY